MALLIAVLFMAIGWTIAHNPDRTVRALTFRVEAGPRTLVGFCRVLGWVWAAFFGIGAIVFLGEIARDLLRSL